MDDHVLSVQRRSMTRAWLGLLGLLVISIGCNVTNPMDAGSEVSIVGQPPLDVVGADVPTIDAAADATAALPSGFFPAIPPAFTPTTDEPLSVQVSISGESLAEHGYDYSSTPATGQPVFVDGWELRFDHYVVVIDHVRLNQPGPDPTMRAGLGGLVAQQDGPWIVDVHKAGTLSGAGGPPETAVPMFVFRMPTAGGAFDPSVRYAFSFDTVPASPAVQNLNLTPDTANIAADMIAHQWTKYFSGTATYRGRAATSSVDPSFVGYPTTVHFGFGFGDPASYINCHNPELGQMDSAATRGLQPSATGHVRAQITMHTDHFFWDEADVEGTPLRFDAIAARANGFGGDAGSSLEVTLDALAHDLPASLTDALGAPVLDRGAQTAGVIDNSPPPSYAVHTAAGSVGSLRDFVVYNVRGQGHLNSDGLCFVWPSAPISF